jgi:hypothetical protein
VLSKETLSPHFFPKLGWKSINQQRIILKYEWLDFSCSYIFNNVLSLLKAVQQLYYISIHIEINRLKKYYWLIIYCFTLLFYITLEDFSLIWQRHHYRWRAAKCRPMLGTQSFWAGRYFNRVTRAVTRGLGFSGVIRRTASFSRLQSHKGCGGSILTPILTSLMKNTNYRQPLCIFFILIRIIA